jgi:transposase
VYDYTPSRRRDGPAEFLGDYDGYLQADAYGGYDGIYANGKVIEVLCWAHARRKFYDARDSDPARSHEALAYIRGLYIAFRKSNGKGISRKAMAVPRPE